MVRLFDSTYVQAIRIDFYSSYIRSFAVCYATVAASLSHRELPYNFSTQHLRARSTDGIITRRFHPNHSELFEHILFYIHQIPTWATPNSYSCYSRLSATSCRNALFWWSLQAVGLPARSLQGSSDLSSQRLLLRPRDCYANIQWPQCTANCRLEQFRSFILRTSLPGKLIP